MGLEWNGAKLKTKVQQASKLAIDATMADCVTTAKANHPWHNRTGFLLGEIRILEADDGSEGAAAAGPETIGRWGDEANYALYLEIGTSRADSGAPRAEAREAAAGGDMSAIPWPQPWDDPLMWPRPFLRPAADEHYPRLAERIRQAMAAIR